MKLIQFWDRPPIPAEVVAWMDGFRDRNPTFEYEFFDEVRAADFIARHQGARALAAFKAIAVPAMKSDFFRLCAIETWGGAYIDSDHLSLAPLESLLAGETQSIVPIFGEFLNCHFLYFPRPADPFIQACLALSVDNIESRKFTISFMACGPAIYSAVMNVADPTTAAHMLEVYEKNPLMSGWGYAELLERARRLIEPTSQLVAAWRNIKVVSIFELGKWIASESKPPSYKTSAKHWLNWKGSIYKEGDASRPGAVA
jgi:hypothetical protein